MKRIEGRSPKTSDIIYRGLIIVAAILVLLILIGTIYGLIKGKKPAAASPEAGNTNIEEGIFTGIGTMRIRTADKESESLIIRLAFPYNKNDQPFSEELVSRVSMFKSITTEYLGALTAEELAVMDIDVINKELLSRFNSPLLLGKIRELYILEFMRL